MALKILYEDSDILVVYKKAGQLTQSGKNFDVDLTSEVLSYRRKKGEEVYAALINRLDRPVSGIVLFAKNKSEAARLSKIMQTQGFCKQYLAVVCGKPDESKGTFVDYLLKDEQTNTSSVVAKETVGAKRAELNYEVLGEISSYSLVRIQLVTGRHHQIRLQFASRGMALLGDVKYGNVAKDALDAKETLEAKDTKDTSDDKVTVRLGRGEIALCAYSLTVDNKEFKIEPEWTKDYESI